MVFRSMHAYNRFQGQRSSNNEINGGAETEGGTEIEGELIFPASIILNKGESREKTTQPDNYGVRRLASAFGE